MSFIYSTVVAGIPRLKSSADVYDEIYPVVGTITAGTSVTLPSSGTYDSKELELYVNNARLEPVADYNYVGVVPRTQVQFTFDLVVGDRVRFRKDFA